MTPARRRSRSPRTSRRPALGTRALRRRVLERRGRDGRPRDVGRPRPGGRLSRVRAAQSAAISSRPTDRRSLRAAPRSRPGGGSGSCSPRCFRSRRRCRGSSSCTRARSNGRAAALALRRACRDRQDVGRRAHGRVGRRLPSPTTCSRSRRSTGEVVGAPRRRHGLDRPGRARAHVAARPHAAWAGRSAEADKVVLARRASPTAQRDSTASSSSSDRDRRHSRSSALEPDPLPRPREQLQHLRAHPGADREPARDRRAASPRPSRCSSVRIPARVRRRATSRERSSSTRRWPVTSEPTDRRRLAVPRAVKPIAPPAKAGARRRDPRRRTRAFAGCSGAVTSPASSRRCAGRRARDRPSAPGDRRPARPCRRSDARLVPFDSRCLVRSLVLTAARPARHRLDARHRCRRRSGVLRARLGRERRRALLPPLDDESRLVEL